MEQQEVRERVLAQFPDAEIEVFGEDCNFQLHVYSEAFRGLSSLQSQKLVYRLFADEIQHGALHALSVRARAER